MRLASTHDPDLLRRIVVLECLVSKADALSTRRATDVFGRLYQAETAIEVIQRQLERLGAPQYRTIRKGNTNIHVERVRKRKR
jgi:hypothetical protein